MKESRIWNLAGDCRVLYPALFWLIKKFSVFIKSRVFGVKFTIYP